MRQVVVGLLAHVDAGKTSLAEAMLFEAGAIRVRGRVDAGDAHLDTDEMERERGITIFASSAAIDWGGAHLMLLDAPGHVDFSAEAERTLAELDLALLVVGANDGVQGHTETLMRLAARHGLPVAVFVNKMDLANADGPAILGERRARLPVLCIDARALAAGDEAALEDAAQADEDALEEYLATGGLAPDTVARLVLDRKIVPVLFGSALRGTGVRELLDLLAALAPDRPWPAAFGARVFRISRSKRGERLAWLKVTGGMLRAKTVVTGFENGAAWEEKVDQVRLYQGDAFQTVSEVGAGGICAVTGLTHVVPGSSLGAEPKAPRPVLAPVLSYQVIPASEDLSAVVRALRELADEDPMLNVAWHEHLQEVHVQLMGEVQREVIGDLMRRRFGLEVSFGPGGILYQETVTGSFRGVGHFEPLRHYAEVHLEVEGAPRGAGIQVGTRASEDDLDRNWQRLIATHLLEREHAGVLTGAPLADLRIQILGGRAHAKHTEGGDFRQATYRALRQALMEARRAGACELLEPWYRFTLAVPAEKVGRALADLAARSAVFEAPVTEGAMVSIEGDAPASELQGYALDVTAYTGGRGRLALEFAGYRACHDADSVIEAAAYDPEADLANTPDSVFCAHGAGYTVKWDEVPAHAHVAIDPARLRPWRAADASFFSAARG